MSKTLNQNIGRQKTIDLHIDYRSHYSKLETPTQNEIKQPIHIKTIRKKKRSTKLLITLQRDNQNSEVTVWKGTNHAIINLIQSSMARAHPGSLHSFVSLIFAHFLAL